MKFIVIGLIASQVSALPKMDAGKDCVDATTANTCTDPVNATPATKFVAADGSKTSCHMVTRGMGTTENDYFIQDAGSVYDTTANLASAYGYACTTDVGKATAVPPTASLCKNVFDTN